MPTNAPRGPWMSAPLFLVILAFLAALVAIFSGLIG
jgi:hypothetical protein